MFVVGCYVVAFWLGFWFCVYLWVFVGYVVVTCSFGWLVIAIGIYGAWGCWLPLGFGFTIAVLVSAVLV